MKTLSQFISFALIFNFILYPSHTSAQSTSLPAKKVNFSIVKILADELKTNPKDYFSQEELSLKETVAEKGVTNLALEEIKKKLLDESYSFSEIKQQIHSQLIQEEQNRLIELKYILAKASTERLDQFFQMALDQGQYDPELRLVYDSAYNQHEKIEVIMQMVHSDLGMIRTLNAKQIGLMSRADLLKQLETSGTFATHKNDKVITVIIIVLAVAVAGLATWGIISATKARHERKKKEMNDDFDTREQQAQQDFENSIKNLDEVFKERERLREEGYVWQVCSTTKTFKTATCSYNYQTHSGQETCVTHCLKQPVTNHETMHTKSCLVDFIPNNCFQKNPTEAGYDDGYSRGYSNGYDSGYDTAYDDAYRSAYNQAYSSAYYRGYDSGYSAGFSSGYSAGSSKSLPPMLKLLKGMANDEHELGYSKGYQEGYAYALNLRVGNF